MDSFDMYPPAGNPNEAQGSGPPMANQAKEPPMPPQQDPTQPPPRPTWPPHTNENQPPQPQQPAQQKPNENVTPQQQALLAAIEAGFIASRAKAIANLNNYMMTPVGVGEHPDIVIEATKLMEQINHADGMLQTLRRITAS